MNPPEMIEEKKIKLAHGKLVGLPHFVGGWYERNNHFGGHGFEIAVFSEKSIVVLTAKIEGKNSVPEVYLKTDLWNAELAEAVIRTIKDKKKLMTGFKKPVGHIFSEIIKRFPEAEAAVA